MAENVLNFKLNTLPSLLPRGNNFVIIFIVRLAFGGSCARNIRHVFARGENGLNFVDTSVMNLVIMLRRA